MTGKAWWWPIPPEGEQVPVFLGEVTSVTLDDSKERDQ
jgi:hypothetical protein